MCVERRTVQKPNPYFNLLVFPGQNIIVGSVVLAFVPFNKATKSGSGIYCSKSCQSPQLYITNPQSLEGGPTIVQV